MDKYFNFGKNEFIINNLESDNFVERNEADQEVNGNLAVDGNLIVTNLNVTDNFTANHMTTNGDISTKDGLIQHLVIDGEPVNNKNFGDYAEYKDTDDTDKFKGYAIGAGEDKLYVFANTTSRPLQDTDLDTLPKGTVSVRIPQTSDECANKEYVDNHTSGNYLPLTGGTMSGDLNMNNHNITGIRQYRLNSNWGRMVGFSGVTLLQSSQTSNLLKIGKFDTNDNVISFDTHNKIIDVLGLIDMSNNKIINLPNGESFGDAVNKSQLDTKLNLTGGSLSGDLSLAGNNLFNANEINLSGNNGRFVYFSTGVGAGTNIQSAQANNTIYFSPHASTSKTLNLNTLTKLSSFYGNIDINNNKLVNLSNASQLGDAVNYSQLLTRLSTSGGTMTGPLNFDPNIYIRTVASRDGKIAIGMGATPSNKGNNSIGIGSFAGQTDQGIGAVAIGASAGYGSQGANAIAVGNLAGYTGNNGSTSQASNSIILNATGTNYTTGQTNSFNVKPIRNSNSNDKMLKYNPTSGEITYHNDVNVQTVQKLAVYLNNITTSSNVGTHTFEFDEPLTNTTSFLITVNFNEEYTGTFANSSQVTVDYSFRNISNGITSQVSKSFYPFVKDIGGSTEFVSNQFKVLLGASITTKKLVINIDDGYTTGTKTYYHTIEVERVN